MNCDVESVQGSEGDFTVKIRRRPGYIDSAKCTGCAVCFTHCPIETPDTFNLGMDVVPAVAIDYQQQVPRVFTINRDICLGCGLCFEVCEAKAVDYLQKEESEDIKVGSIIISAGSELFDSDTKSEFGHGRFKNVLSCLEFERMLSAGGPYRGLVLRPSDGREPNKLAFIQCVGSRDTRAGKDYCSAACCMYAVKEAVIAKEHLHDLQSTIFFMDMRSFGKDFDKYVDRAKEKGVRFLRSRVSNIEENPQTNTLIIKYETEDGAFHTEEFDMVVLSAGLSAPRTAEELSRIFGIELTQYNFAKTKEFVPLATTRSGIYAIGTFQGPKDIPETVTQSSAAASLSSAALAEARGTLIIKPAPVEAIDTRGQAPRIGVFICHCGINIAGYVDVAEVEEYVKSLPDVVYTERNLFTCSQDTQEKMKQVIKEKGLNRVVVASCTPRTHEPLFQETCEGAGLNPYLFEMANIRDQCSWVHMTQRKEATEKAKSLVRMAVNKARRLQPLERLRFPVTRKALVIGGGLSGMTAAIGTAKQGFEVCLVEREKELGGHLHHIHFTLSGENPQEFLKNLQNQVTQNEKITTLLSSRVKKIDGFVGNYKTTIETLKGDLEFDHGVVIVATGAKEYKPAEYLYGKNPRVLTQSELEQKLANSEKDVTSANTFVMIQCVGSRNDEHPYCSRFCCTQAVKNALEIIRRNPRANIYILYRDIRTYGMRELAFREAREKGVIFLRYEQEEPPSLEGKNGKLFVSAKDPIIGERLRIPADYVVLAAATVPYEDSAELARMLKVPLNEDGFYLEAHMKLRPVDFATDGVFMAGLCHFPKFMEESIIQANAAVARACTILTLEEIEVPGTIAEVNRAKCSACGFCESVCPSAAVKVKEEVDRRGNVLRYAEVTAALCKGCGSCAASCRSGAIDIKGIDNSQVMSLIEAF
jgi:heterodisulfide reductase subunit A